MNKGLPCERKQWYYCEHRAKQFHKLSRKHLAPFLRHTLDVYKCEFCDGWHLGKLKERVTAAEAAEHERLEGLK